MTYLFLSNLDFFKEYEVVEEDEGISNGEWEKELEDMLGEAPEAKEDSKKD